MKLTQVSKARLSFPSNNEQHWFGKVLSLILLNIDSVDIHYRHNQRHE